MQNNELWHVDDSFLDNPGLKFAKNSSPLVEATVENWGCYQFDRAPVPVEMETFVTRFLHMLHIPSTNFATVKEVCHYAMTRIEYEEPYFYLVDMLAQITHSEQHNTYRHKTTGDILNPCNIEVFRIEKGWAFEPYNVVKNMIEHPGMKLFLECNVVPPQFKTWHEAMIKLLTSISEIVWGKFGWLEDFVDGMMNACEENYVYGDSDHRDVYDMDRVQGSMEHDRLFWLAATLGVMTWFKGPGALPFLTEYHVIYGNLLEVDEHGKCKLDTKSGGEAVVDGSWVYTLQHLEVIPSKLPDTCVCCGTSLHCTKHINVTALEHPVCFCGTEVDPMDANGCRHTSKDCRAYQTKHPARMGFACQRCIFKLVRKLPQDIKCGRAKCPALSCPHHQGEAARLRGLTESRTRQLTAGGTH